MASQFFCNNKDPKNSKNPKKESLSGMFDKMDIGGGGSSSSGGGGGGSSSRS